MNHLAKLLPPPGFGRQLAIQSTIYAIGSGLFLAGSAVFFTRVVGLDSTMVGVGLSLSAAISMVLAIPMGSFADRIGSRRTWILGIFVQAAIFGLYPLVRGAAAFLVVVSVLAIFDGLSNAGRSMYTLEMIPAEDRVKILAYQRSAMNVGFTVGAGAAAIALWIDTRPAYLVLPLGYALILIVNLVFVYRMPASEGVARVARAQRGPVFAVLTDRSYMSISAIAALLISGEVLLMVVLPLWLLQHTAVPKVLIAWLAIINTVMVVFLQVPASRGAEDVPGAARSLRRAGVALAVACAIIALSTSTSGPATIVLVITAAVFFTGAEMFQAAGLWGLNACLPPAERRGQYLGASRMTNQLQRALTPAAFTALTVGWGNPTSWLFIAAGAAFLGLAAVPVAAWAQRSPRLGDTDRDSVTVVVGAPQPD